MQNSCRLTFLLVLSLQMVVGAAWGQQAPQPTTPQPSATPPQTSSTSQETSDVLKPAQIEALVAPIALYPDALLSQVLIASTYPLEVVEGARWLKSNPDLKGDALKQAVDKQSWDASIKSLTVTSSVLEMMNERLDWTQKLGDAVLAQRFDVMDAIQRLRSRAAANNKLADTPQQRVIKTKENNRDVIVIEPATPDSIYVPYYDPAVVFGAWPYPEYPPYYWAAPGYIAAAVIATGVAFGTAYAIGRWASGGWGWGGGFAWGYDNINFNRPININNRNGFISGQTWHHDPNHRRGVPYHNASVRQQFSGNRNLSGRTDKMDFRGRNGQQVLHPNARQAATNRPGGNRAERNIAPRSKSTMKQRSPARAGNRSGAIRPRSNFHQRPAIRGRASFQRHAIGGGRFQGRGGFRGGAFRGGGGFGGGRGGGFHRR